MDFILFFLFVAVVGGLAGAVAGFTHHVVISNKLAQLHAAIAKLEALKKVL